MRWRCWARSFFSPPSPELVSPEMGNRLQIFGTFLGARQQVKREIYEHIGASSVLSEVAKYFRIDQANCYNVGREHGDLPSNLRGYSTFDKAKWWIYPSNRADLS